MAPRIAKPVITESLKNCAFWRAVFAEFLGTGILVFIGCGSVDLRLNNTTPASAADTVRISLAFGFAILILVKALGPISGCHINPAVSISFMLVGKVSLLRTLFYIPAQCLGAVVGSLFLYGVLPEEFRKTLGYNDLKNGLTPIQGFGTEAVFTFILIMSISACLDEQRVEHFYMKVTNPLTIGLTVSAIHLVGVCSEIILFNCFNNCNCSMLDSLYRHRNKSSQNFRPRNCY